MLFNIVSASDLSKVSPAFTLSKITNNLSLASSKNSALLCSPLFLILSYAPPKIFKILVAYIISFTNKKAYQPRYYSKLIGLCYVIQL